jgi:hypothetical protein
MASDDKRPVITKDPETLDTLSAAIDESMPLAQIEKMIHRLPISADAKGVVLSIAKVSVQLGDALLRVGRLIVSFIIDLARRFPNTTFGVVASIVVTMLIAAIPLIGSFLWPFLGPLLAAFGIVIGVTNDMRESALRARIGLLDRMAEAEKSGILDRIEAFERRFRHFKDIEIFAQDRKDGE